MSQNNTLSAKAQNIIAKFINKNSHKSSISRTDVMKHAIVTLYAQMPEAKSELIAKFKDCIFDLHDHFTQEEIDVLVTECPQVILYCLKFSDVMSHIDFYDYHNELAEEIISDDAPLNIYKTPESIIELCTRLSGKPKANDKVYMPYSDFADYPLYNPKAEYTIECEGSYCEDKDILQNYTNAYAQILLDSQKIKYEIIHGDSSWKNGFIFSMHPDHIFACNPTLNQKSYGSLYITDGMWLSPQKVKSFDLGQNIFAWISLLKACGSMDLILPRDYFYEAGIWDSLRVCFNEIKFNATFITLSSRLFECVHGDVFLLHIEKEKGNEGMIRFIDATGDDFYKKSGFTEKTYTALMDALTNDRNSSTDVTNPKDYQMGGLNVDFLMDIVNQKECNSKYEERLHYTQFFGKDEHAAHQHIIDKKLPTLAEGERYIALQELVDVVPMTKVEEKDCEIRVLENSSLHSDYMDCDIYSNALQQKKLNRTDSFFDENHFIVNNDCLAFGIFYHYRENTKVGKLQNIDSPIAIREGIVPFKRKSSSITEEYLLRELTKDYCLMQAKMLSEYDGRTYLIEPEYFLDIKIAVPSVVEQERRCKGDAQAYLKEADKKLIQSAEEFRRDVHMKKHAIGQTLFNLSNWWDLLMKVRKEGNGIIDDKTEIGKNNKVIASDIFANIQMTIEMLQIQVDKFWTADGFNTQAISLNAFVKEYMRSHQSPLFKYCCVEDSQISGNDNFEIKFDKEALTMVFDNIINNACCHGFANTAPDKNAVKIEIGMENSPYIIISNNGKPFHEALTAEDVFTYGRSSNVGHNHYGIGGYEVRNIMRKFGGEAEFISTPEKEFTVSYKLTFKRIDNIQK